MSKEHQATMRKINLRILPFLMLLYLIAYIDRSNISVAALGMNADLGLTSRMYGLAAGLFFLTYIIFEVPSNVALTKFGARRWIARIMISWGLVAMGMAFITSAYQLYGMRLLLGAAEAGFTPGIIYYLARWYPSQERAHAMSFFYIGAALASVIGLPLSGLLLHADGALGVAGWRWVFFVEGLPAVLLGFVVLWFLPDRPSDASWLSQAEAYELERKIDDEQGTGQSEHKTGWQTAFRNGNVWLLAAFWLLQAFGTIGITLFMPLIVRSIASGDDLAISLLSAVPFIAACIFMFFNGRHSDSTRERAYHLGVPLTLAGLLLLAAVYIGNAHLSYVLIVLSVGLNWAVIPIFWAVTTEYVSGLTAAVSIALINALANVAGLVLPPAIGWIKDTTNSYDLALTLVSAALIMGGLLGISLAKKLAAPKGHQTIIDIRNSADPVGSSKRH
ncbi:MFS transporter [Brucella oryzae]|uniref:MFS transporter n=1 Tax=Brucella oryzae TaxID=335286 RepID=UPI001B81A44C|nr:MFS transporter [Brucella oryzae]MBR7654355.1 MFS transporter [Brucella oryzae]